VELVQAKYPTAQSVVSRHRTRAYEGTKFRLGWRARARQV